MNTFWDLVLSLVKALFILVGIIIIEWCFDCDFTFKQIMGLFMVFHLIGLASSTIED